MAEGSASSADAGKVTAPSEKFAAERAWLEREERYRREGHGQALGSVYLRTIWDELERVRMENQKLRKQVACPHNYPGCEHEPDECRECGMRFP